MRTLRNLALLAIALTLLFTGAILLGEAVPNGPIVAHLREAQGTPEHPGLLAQNYYPSALTGGKVDVYTDCVAMGNGVASNPALGLWERAIRSHVIGNCEFLTTWLAGQPVGSVDYFRYWNGYTVVTRSLLATIGYAPLRDGATGVAVALLGALGVLMWRRLSLRVALCFVAALLFVGIDVAVVTVVHSVAWSIAAGAGIWVLLARPDQRWRPEPWFVIGALVTFLELLNNALVTLTLPLALALLAVPADAPLTTRESVRRTAIVGASWALGYFGLWIIKFLLSWATIGQEAIAVISDKALEKLAGNTAVGAPHVGLPTWSNLQQLTQPGWRLWCVTVLAALLAGQAILRRRPLGGIPPLALVVVGLTPFVWYEVFAQHSIVHTFFTARLLMPTVFLLLVAATRAVRTE